MPKNDSVLGELLERKAFGIKVWKIGLILVIFVIIVMIY